MSDRVRQVAATCLADYFRRIETCVQPFSEEQVWWRPNPAVNSVGNLLLHLRGNLSQWVLAAFGNAAYDRHRSQEFAAVGNLSKAELLDGLREVVEGCQAVIRNLPDAELARVRTIQGTDVDGYYAVIHVVEHLSYHAGQVIQIAKLLLGPEAGIEFFPHLRNT